MQPASDQTVRPVLRPTLSVVVPAYRCAGMLRESLGALTRSTVSREQWELIVVDDGSPDETGAVGAQFADRVVRVSDGPRGPGHARNQGVHEAHGELILFVDADVLVHPDALERVLAAFTADPTLVALFGAYDATPAAPGLISQYRNLLHRHVHVEGAGAASTFWAGIGAVRRDAFLAVGGFDAARFPRPQIEDIELGYRLHDRGGTLRLDPRITGTHLKRWTLGNMLRTDLRDRAVPWMRLLLERHAALASGPLNTSRREQLLVAAMATALVALGVFMVQRSAAWLLTSVGALSVVLVGNARLFTWFARVRGTRFALATVPLRLLFYITGLFGALWAVATWMLRPGLIVRRERRRGPVRRAVRQNT